MRYNPTLNGACYTETQPLWDIYTRDPQKIWYRKPLESKHIIRHWRDIEGSRLPEVSHQNLFFSEWLLTRIREEACLPQYYSVGNRFIRITRAFPAGFKCEPLPISLRDARVVRKLERQLAKERKRNAKKQKKLIAELMAAKKNKKLK